MIWIRLGVVGAYLVKEVASETIQYQTLKMECNEISLNNVER